MEDQDSFFQFFTPAVTDLTSLAQEVEDDDEAAADELAEKAEQAEADFELASFIRTRVIPRALLFFTGDDDDDTSYGGKEFSVTLAFLSRRLLSPCADLLPFFFSSFIPNATTLTWKI